MTDRGSISPNASPPSGAPQPAACGPAFFRPVRLTPQQYKVVALKCSYYTQTEIAAQLGVSKAWVGEILRCARKKFGAVSTGEMLRLARLRGIGA